VLFITPLGDLIRRRQLILLCLFISTASTVVRNPAGYKTKNKTSLQGLAVTNSFIAFEILSFFVGTTSVIPTVMQVRAASRKV
jgi:hypothetical protein